jgi:protease IV
MKYKTEQALKKLWKRTQQAARILMKTAVFFCVLWLLMMVGGAIWLYREFVAAPRVKPETVLTLNIRGGILDGPSVDPLVQRILGEDAQTRQGIVNNIKKASQDARILGIFLNIEEYYMTSEVALEIRDALLAFKQSGKKIFAYTEYAGKLTYLLISPADKTYLSPAGDIALGGWRAEIPFYKDMFDKIGVTPEFIAFGKYKTAPQIFTMNHMSDEYREVINDLLDAYSTDFVAQIAAVRKVSPDTVQTWIDDGIYSATEALKAGMVDELHFENEVEQCIRVELGLTAKDKQPAAANPSEPPADPPKLKTINNSQYARVKVAVPGLHDNGQKIAVVYAQGSIVSGSSSSSPYDPMIASETMTELLKQLTDDKTIKGILLRIDSGGGSAFASETIWNAVRTAQQKKPVVVSMTGAAASGGYMISAPAASIVAYPLTVTGSIGIFGGKFSLEGLYDWIGLNIEPVQRGENAGMFTDTRVWTETEKARLQVLIQEGYDTFLAKVAEGRGMTVDAVHAIAQGRVWTGQEALKNGLVDKLGGLETALNVLKEKIGIPEKEDVQLVEYPKLKDPFRTIIKRLRSTQVATQFPLPPELQQVQQQLADLRRMQNERLFAWFPLTLSME